MDMRYATASSKVATWFLPASRGRQPSGLPIETEDAPTDRSRATGVLEGDEHRSEQCRLLSLGQVLYQPRCFSERRTVDPLVRTLRAAGRHHNVAALAPHVEPRTEKPCAVADIRLPRVAEVDVDAASPSARPSRLRNRSAGLLKLP